MSEAEKLFIKIFCEIYGYSNENYLLKYNNYPFTDSQNRNRRADFVFFMKNKKVAIEIEGETYHNPANVRQEKYSDDLLRANDQILQGWIRLSFTPRSLFENVDIVKKQLRAFLDLIRISLMKIVMIMKATISTMIIYLEKNINHLEEIKLKSKVL